MRREVGEFNHESLDKKIKDLESKLDELGVDFEKNLWRESSNVVMKFGYLVYLRKEYSFAGGKYE